MRIEGCDLKPHAWACVALLWSGTVPAIGTFVPYGGVQYEYNSNLFALSSSESVQTPTTGLPPILLPPADTGERRSDQTIRYLAGLETSLQLGQQKLRGKLEGRRLEFDHFTRLDHDEYLFGGGLDWRLGSIVDGIIEYRQERRMAAFAERDSTALSMELERIARADVGLAFHPDWRAEAGVRARDFDSPLDDVPDFGLKENAINAAIKYLAEDTLTAGVFVEFLEGEFKGTENPAEFEQQTAALTASYLISGFTRVGAEIGYTQREDDTGDDSELSGVTGALSYHRELSGKTSVDAQVFRRVGSYVGGASSEKQTGAAIGINWSPTAKILVNLAYQRGQSELSETQDSSSVPDRDDDLQTASVQIRYSLLPWLSLRPYGLYQERDSSNAPDSFHATTAGIEFLARFE